MPGVREEVQRSAGRQRGDAGGTGGEQVAAAGVEGAVQLRHERQRRRGEDLLVAVVPGADDLDAFGQLHAALLTVVG